MTQEDQTAISKGTLPNKVNAEVVSHLSFGLYRNFARAVKELISNSYDAGATEVKIKLDLDNDLIIVRDNGKGMTLKEIEDKFLHIARRTPLTENIDELGRKRIGSFGIGFLSIFPYCKELQLITKKEGTDIIIEVNIDTEQFFSAGTFKKITDIEVPYESSNSDIPIEKGETIIILKKIAPHIIQELTEETHSMYSIDKIGGYEKFKWTLAQYAPIQYPPNRQDLKSFFDYPDKVPMRLWLNAEELFRNVSEHTIILESGGETFGNVVLRYTIMTPKEPVKLREARGLQVRLRDVAIGFPTDFDVIKVTGTVPGKLNYLCGEIHILSGLESAVMIDRDSFSYTEDVAHFQEFFRKKLVTWNNELEKWARGDKQIYESLMDIPDTEKVVEELKNANILHLSKERLRLPKRSSLIESKTKKKSSTSKKIKEAFSENTNFKIVETKDEVAADVPPVKVMPETKTILVYEKHPAFVEEIEFNKTKFKVTYKEWDINKTPYKICELGGEENEAVFNTAHPLFNSKLSDEIVKKLSLGILLISHNRNDEKDLLVQLNCLLEEVFLES